MKKLITFLLVLLFCFASAASAATLKFEAAEYATGYMVFYDSTEGPRSYDIGNVTSQDLEIFNLTPEVAYTLHVKAYNTKGLGGASNSVDWIEPEFIPVDNPKPVTLVIPGPVTIIIN